MLNYKKMIDITALPFFITFIIIIIIIIIIFIILFSFY